MKTNTQKLFRRDFTLVVIGQIISLFGNAILRFALPLYLLRETGSSSLFGAVTACSMIPMIVLSLIGGILADRVNKRNIMVILDFSTAILITVFYLSLGKVPTVPLFIVVLMLLYGISGTYQPAVQASIPALVSDENLMAGNAVINQVSTLSGLLGPVIGGAIFGAAGIFPILLVSIVCFAVSAVMEIFIHIPHQRQPRTQGIFRVAREDLAESYRFVRTEKPIFFTVVFLVAAFNLVLSAVMMIGIPVLVVQVLGMSDMRMGLAEAALALGGLVGGLLAAVLPQRLHLKDSPFLLAACSLAVGIVGLALMAGLPAEACYWVITGLSFAAMGAATLFSVQMLTLVQRESPAHLVGKILAAMISISMCAQPVGQALYGVLFDRFAGSEWVVMIGAAVVSLLIGLYSKRVFSKIED